MRGKSYSLIFYLEEIMTNYFGTYQPYNPYNNYMPPAMNLAAAQDFKGFYNEEIAIRRALIFPPLCDMCILCFAGTDEEEVRGGAAAVIQLMNTKLSQLQPKTPVRVLGPVRASYGRLNGKFRWRIIIKMKNTAEMRGFISSLLTEGAKLKEMKKIAFYADINGDVGV
jgi:primosomal protein N' (replication factor Y)